MESMYVFVWNIYCNAYFVSCLATVLSNFRMQIKDDASVCMRLCCVIRPRHFTTMLSHGSLASHFWLHWLSSTLHWKLALCPRSLPPCNSHLADEMFHVIYWHMRLSKLVWLLVWFTQCHACTSLALQVQCCCYLSSTSLLYGLLPYLPLPLFPFPKFPVAVLSRVT